jgi:hypothetical protein
MAVGLHGSSSPEAVHRMVGDALDDAAQIRLGVEPVPLRRLDQAGDRRGPLAAGLGAGEAPVATTDRNRAHGTLCRRVVDAGAAVAQG